MMSHRATPVFLSLAGLLLLAIGAGLLFAPHAFHASNGITLGSDPNLLSEVRAPGGLLLGAAILILRGAFSPAGRTRALGLTVLVYGAFGLARLVGVALDGVPSSGIMTAMVIELVVAGVGLVAVRSVRSGAKARESSLQVSGDGVQDLVGGL